MAKIYDVTRYFSVSTLTDMRSGVLVELEVKDIKNEKKYAFFPNFTATFKRDVISIEMTEYINKNSVSCL